MKKGITPSKYPIRTCRYFDHCFACGKTIQSGDKYYDGGYNRRFHKHCVKEGEVFTQADRVEPEERIVQ